MEKQKYIIWFSVILCLTSMITYTKTSKSIIDDSIKTFLSSLRDSDIVQFKSLVDNDGFIIIRNFISGTLGGRGQNIRNSYTKETIPPKLEFTIPGEIAFIPKQLFSACITSKNISKQQLNINVIIISKYQPSTEKIIDFCKLVIAKYNPDFDPLIIILNNGFVLAEAKLINGMPIGSWAIFEKKKNKYYIKALIDLK